MLKSIVKSKYIIPNNEIHSVKNRVIFPNMQKLAKKSVTELRGIKLKNVWWIGFRMIGFTLNDGQSSKEGNTPKCFGKDFDPKKKITSVECLIDKEEVSFNQINFYSGTERLARIGDREDRTDDDRREVFNIAEDEQLIGCELHQLNSDLNNNEIR